jgi:HD-GYP domain-containing protein (c-di-GMP phosphodiesterase class II)
MGHSSIGELNLVKNGQMRELNDIHYLRAVTELGDTRKIVANCDIYSQNGIKLVAAGVRITSDLYERLVKHKLLSFDKALSVENMLNLESIRDDVRYLLQENDKQERMSKAFDKSFFDHQLLAIQLPPPLAFKLTVAREKYRHIYQHSLLLMVIAAYLARCDGMDAREQALVSTAALFHDIGLLHIDPKLLDPSHMMSDGERAHLYAHPLTAYLLLCEFPEMPRKIADAVLEHHERMDGSGYPRGLCRNKISRYGQILAIAELAAIAFDSDHPKVPWKKLDVILKLNSRQHGQGLIGHLNIFREKDPDEVPSSIKDTAHLVAQVNLISKLFEDVNSNSESGQRDKIFDLAKTRLDALRLELFDAGFDPRDPAGLAQRFIDDPECMSEYGPLLNEALWQFKALMLEISRHWTEKEIQPEKPEHAWLNDLKQSLLAANLDN